MTLNMPKISWQRHRLAELTASLNHTGKEAVEEVRSGRARTKHGLFPLFQGILGRPASDWSHDLEEEEEGPLELVTRRIEQGRRRSSVLASELGNSVKSFVAIIISHLVTLVSAVAAYSNCAAECTPVAVITATCPPPGMCPRPGRCTLLSTVRYTRRYAACYSVPYAARYALYFSSDDWDTLLETTSEYLP